MAITILQEPTSPNVSSTNLIYTVSSSNVPQFQYRYIADLYYSGSATKLARFKYPQNSSGTVNIDLGRPIGDYLETNYDWNTAIQTANSSSYKPFRIEFGEEYGTSYNSAVTTFSNEASASILVLKGNIQYPSVGAYDPATNTRTNATSSINWNNLSYKVSGSGFTQFDIDTYSDHGLTNDPNKLNGFVTSKYWNDENIDVQKSGSYLIGEAYYVSSSIGWWAAKPIGTDDFETISQINGVSEASALRFTVFDDSNTEIANGISNFTSVQDTVSTLQTGISQLTGSISSSAQWNWYALEYLTTPSANGNVFPIFYYNEDKGPDTLLSTNITVDSTKWLNSALPPGGIRPGLWKSNRYYPTNCKDEKTRFAFINSFGVWDYYNVYMPTRRVTKVDRKMYEQERINLNDRIATYNVSNRGEKQYYTEYTDEFEITTDIIDDKESQWLREMFESSEVYIQSGSDFIPINILNNKETIINNKARNKNYQYTIRYQFSNLREPR